MTGEIPVLIRLFNLGAMKPLKYRRRNNKEKQLMDLIRGDVRKLFFRYLTTALGSAMIMSIYSVVDMAMVGQYQGPEGTAALAVFAPCWNIIYSLGLLTGLGGGVLFAASRGGGRERRAEEYFTIAMAWAAIFSLASQFAICFFDEELLTFFGADDKLLPVALSYMLPIKFAVPFFVFSQTLAAFLRDDASPVLASAAAAIGGVYNMIADYLFVFTFDMGVMGAGLATATGAMITVLIMLSHFISKNNTLHFVVPRMFFFKTRKMLVTGFSTFFADISMGILTVLFNRQIMRYFGTDALAVYGVIVNIGTFVQCCGYGIGQATQPLLSANFGAKKPQRILAFLRYSLITSACFGLFWAISALAVPNLFVRIFMAPTASVLAIAPFIIRSYGTSFLLLPLNIFAAYYFQSIMLPAHSFAVTFARGLALSGSLIIILPFIAGPGALWFAMPLTELIVFAAASYFIRRSQKNLLLS